MAAGLTSAAAAAALSAGVDGYRWVQLHTGSPGAAGNANVAGESTRKQLTFTGTNPLSNAGALTWDPVAATEVISYASGWDTESGGNCGWTSDEMTSDEEDRSLTAGDRFTIAIGDITITMPTAS